ncbi:MAG: hypothetical protein DMD81_02870 [Candidatus Rokuibacteriota bacterium]|nr:MAG: hypothetical protein DMD81_02870 [Candidatus Rokubacteria bacterium]
MSTLDDLRQVIRRIERRHAPRPAPEPLETIVGGTLLETDHGRVVLVRHDYPLAHRHGREKLEDAFLLSADAMTLLARAGEELVDPRGLVFVDVETTGLAGGTGTYAFLVGVGALEADRFVVTQYFMRDFDDEPALLAALEPRLAHASGVVTFNGSSFDLPLLETRFILARRRWPVPLPHLDLVTPARRVWVRCFPDCRLATLEREALGLERADDVAGAFIPAIYFQFLRTRHARPLARVFAHNRDDVLSLVGVLAWLGRALAADFPASATPLELIGIGRLWERLDPDRSVACYRGALDGGLSGWPWLWTCLRLAQWEKRRARWNDACELWQRAVRSEIFDPRPWEELAKYHEHRGRDFAAAREIVSSAIALARSTGAGSPVVDRFAYRLGRLERRLSALRRPGG